jgi:hypothetical protein
MGSKGPVKPVFASPTGVEATVAGSVIEGLVTRHSFPDDVAKAQAAVKKEEHLKRMKGLRKELDYLDKTAWQFDPIDKLIGQNPS